MACSHWWADMRVHRLASWPQGGIAPGALPAVWSLWSQAKVDFWNHVFVQLLPLPYPAFLTPSWMFPVSSLNTSLVQVSLSVSASNQSTSISYKHTLTHSQAQSQTLEDLLILRDLSHLQLCSPCDNFSPLIQHCCPDISLHALLAQWHKLEVISF